MGLNKLWIFSKDIEIAPQIIGLIVIGICLLAPQMKVKTHILYLHLAANILVTIQFILLNATAGMFLAILTIIRQIILIPYSIKGKIAPFWTMLLIGIGTIFSIIKGYEKPIDIILIGTLANLYGMWQTRLNIARWCLIITTISVGIYSLAHEGYTGAANEFIQTGSTLIALYRFRKKCDTTEENKELYNSNEEYNTLNKD